ncbi:hypothetical protein H5410_016816 [Solanum commersonii]|uniref:Uncharacterized protein n=1 Tax=Solanum commersonii TaxID=4109 RepID=A0A9J5ZXM9_SOLCO|nr:hypothetical protein H5410_016816 [Solanum commersonii]
MPDLRMLEPRMPDQRMPDPRMPDPRRMFLVARRKNAPAIRNVEGTAAIAKEVLHSQPPLIYSML